MLLKGCHSAGHDGGTETDILLHESPVPDLSSIHVSLENVNPAQNQYVISRDVSTESRSSSAICKSRSLISHQRSEVFEPGGDTDSETECFINDQADIHIEITNDDSDTDDEVDDPKDLRDTINSMVNVDNLNHVKYRRKSGMEDASFDEITGFPVNKRSAPTSRQFSVDYFEVDENGIEIANPIFEEEEFGDDPLFNGCVTTGLNLSDDSLNGNPTYQYGNQSDYTVHGNYRDHCYYNLQDDIENTELCENVKQNSSRSKSISMSLTHKQNDTLQKMHDANELNEDKSKFSRMHSSESYFEKRPNGLVHDVDSDGVFTISSSHVKSSIVPLAVYNSSSLDQTREATNTF